jgi:hypothetical protein
MEFIALDVPVAVRAGELKFTHGVLISGKRSKPIGIVTSPSNPRCGP